MAHPPRINLTVLATREAWARAEARRAVRRAPGGGKAEPMDPNHRRQLYFRQNGSPRWTPAQFRRAQHKMGVIMAREVRAFASS